jgi:hypothetical protein
MDPYETLIHLICHAPDIPSDHSDPGVTDERGIWRQRTPEERLARWRLLYAEAQLAAIERRNQPEAKPVTESAQ